MNKISARLHGLLRRCARWVLARQSTPQLEAMVLHAIARRAEALPPDEALRFLFRLDAELYTVQGLQSVAYGGGVHTKHRHMQYHDFFVNRISSDDRVLDIGCGIGAVAHSVAERTNAQVTGIDLSETNITLARQRHAHPNITYVVGDVLLALPGEQYDVVILSNVLEHLPDRANFLRRVVATAHASHLLIRVPLFERDWRVPLKKELGVEWRLDSTHETEYTLESFAEEIQAAGLKVTHLEVRWGEIWSELIPDES